MSSVLDVNGHFNGTTLTSLDYLKVVKYSVYRRARDVDRKIIVEAEGRVDLMIDLMIELI